MMPRILVDMDFEGDKCGDCKLAGYGYGAWVDDTYRSMCPLFEKPLTDHTRCRACKAAEKAAKKLEEQKE